MFWSTDPFNASTQVFIQKYLVRINGRRPWKFYQIEPNITQIEPNITLIIPNFTQNGTEYYPNCTQYYPNCTQFYANCIKFTQLLPYPTKSRKNTVWLRQIISLSRVNAPGTVTGHTFRVGHLTFS